MQTVLYTARRCALLLVSALALSTFSCQRKAEVSPTPNQPTTGQNLSTEELQLAQQSFRQSGQEGKLVQSWGKKERLNWAPLWASAFKMGAKIYVPLRYTTADQDAPAEMLGSKRFIVLPSAKSTKGIRLAIYAFTKAKEAQYYNDCPATLAAFTGTVFFRDLATGEMRFKKYQLGTPLSKTTKKGNAASSTATTAATTVQVCTTWYECYWESPCNRNGAPYQNHTTTYDEGHCQEPQQEACGIDNWGMSWYSTGSFPTEICEDVDPVDLPYLQDGLYIIRSLDGGQVADVEGISQAAGAKIHLWDFLNAANQKWQITQVYSQGDGQDKIYVYSIVSLNSGKALDLTGGNMANGTPIEQWDNWGGWPQQWVISNDGNGTYRIHNQRTPAQYIGRTSFADGAYLIQAPYPGLAWSIEPTTP